MVYLPLFSQLKFPGNASLMNSIMISIATFDLIDTESIDDQMYYFPEEDPFNLNFQQSGYESNFILKNIGLILWMIFGYFLLHLSFIMMFKCKKIRSKIGKYLYWNGSIRFFFEAFYEVTLLSILNIYKNEWGNDFKSILYSNLISIFFLLFILTLPFIFLVYYCCKRPQWRD